MDAYRFKVLLLVTGFGIMVSGLVLMIAIGITPANHRRKLDLVVRFCMFTGGALLLISSA